MKKILIMEDFSALAVEWSEAFDHAGHKTTVCHNGEEAIGFLKTESFDLVITDMFTQTEKGGLHVLLQISTMGSSAPPVIAVTGQTLLRAQGPEDNLFLQQARSLGAASYMQKPFSTDELLAEAKKYLDLDTH